MLIEYARNLLNFKGAGHEENEAQGKKLIISNLACSLKEKLEEVHISDKQSWLYNVLKTDKLMGHFNCSYGVNPGYTNLLNQYPLTISAFSPEHETACF